MKAETTRNILRYWLQCIRYEEALATRPKAWRKAALLPGMVSVNLKEPTEGRTYFKISLAEVGTLIDGESNTVTKPIDADIAGFFESWLSRQYRLTEHADEGPEIMVTCPTAQLRYGDLAGVIRFTAALTFTNRDGEPFVVPTRKERRHGILPKPPTEVQIRRVPPEEGLPFFIDTRLLTRELMATREEVDELFTALVAASTDTDTPCSMATLLGRFTAGLDGQPETGNVTELLERLTRELSRRLTASPRKERCYPVGIVMDAGRVKTTWHLQRELKRLISSRDDFETRPALRHYMRRTPSPIRREVVKGVFDEGGLTPSQQRAAGIFLGTALSAVEGPPGTGKTTLVMHLGAHLLVERIAAYIATDRMPTDICVVTSTNNRAVDNVIDGLLRVTGETNLPLAVRVGSRYICREVFAPRLRHIEQWLKARALSGAPEAAPKMLEAARHRFTETLNALEALLATEETRQAALAERASLEEHIAALETADDAPEEGVPGSHRELARIRTVVTRLERRLDTLSIKCEGNATRQRLRKLRRYFETKVEPAWATAAAALDAVGLRLELFTLPADDLPSLEEAFERWESGAEAALDRVYDLLSEVDARSAAVKRREKRRTLTRALRDLEIPEAVPVDESRANGLRAALFHQALEVRSAYVDCHVETHLAAIADLCRAAEDQGSLRRFARVHRESFALVSALFPVWGATLLSLGNVFDDGPGTIRRIIIDEAGQCHPAYAVSALMRCDSAMILGDVHQLTPVFSLTEQDERTILRGVFGEQTDAFIDFRVFDRSAASVQRLAEQGAQQVARLTDHFRCQAEIIAISNRLCAYRLDVHTPRRSRADRLPALDRPVRFCHIDGAAERLGGSWWNPQEAGAVIDWLDRLLDAGIPADDIAVITPYRGQLYQLRRAVAGRGIPIEASSELLEETDPSAQIERSGLAIGTVHRFQGGERSIVLFSTVVTTPRALTFLNERVNLINVAVSRARDHLVIIGHEPTLSAGRLSRLLVFAT